MTLAVLGAKAFLAVLLLVAGGAKLADLGGFGAVIAMFLPAAVRERLAGGRDPAASAVAPVAPVAVAAAVVVAAELLAGAVSLCWPEVGSANLAVLALASGFSCVAAVGYARHRGRPCRCLGALTRRRFGVRGLLQALLVTAGAALAARPVRAGLLQLGSATHLLLLAAAAIVVLAAYTAAGALMTAGDQPGMAS